MITAHIEQLHQCLPELKAFFPAHYEELALDQDKVPLDPDYDEYLRREAAGQVLCCVLRESGKIVGYFVGFVTPALNYRTCLTLNMAVFWIHPDYRAEDSLSSLEEELLWIELFETVLVEAKRRGVKRYYLGGKVHRNINWVFEHLGMKPADTYWVGWLGE